MKISLKTYFDIGVSYGLGDNIFKQKLSPPNIVQIGIKNSLGTGITHSLKQDSFIQQWRKTALLRVDIPGMELGFENTTGMEFNEFKKHLKNYILNHEIESCDVTIYALGVVFLSLDFSNGLPLKFLNGFIHCFEFAAYEEVVSSLLLKLTRQYVEINLVKPSVSIQSLAKRPLPEIIQDESGIRESKLISSFTPIILCVDKQDDVEEIKKIFMPFDEKHQKTNCKEIKFEYHGTIFFDWSCCILTPRSYDAEECPMTQIQRMLLCIQIAHTFLGVCEAFENLFFSEVLNQADYFIQDKVGGRSPRELNRLRTLALAVVSLTNYESITVAEEDQLYFHTFEKFAKVKEKQRIIQERCEILHNVQVSENLAEEAKRQKALNSIVVFLTGFTFLSVFVDSYSFLKESQNWLPELMHRFIVMGTLVVFIFLTLNFFLRKK